MTLRQPAQAGSRDSLEPSHLFTSEVDAHRISYVRGASKKDEGVRTSVRTGLRPLPRSPQPARRITRGRCPGSTPCRPVALGSNRHPRRRGRALPLEIPHKPPPGGGRHAPQLPRGPSERKESRAAPPPPGAAAESLRVTATEAAQTTLQ